MKSTYFVIWLLTLALPITNAKPASFGNKLAAVEQGKTGNDELVNKIQNANDGMKEDDADLEAIRKAAEEKKSELASQNDVPENVEDTPEATTHEEDGEEVSLPEELTIVNFDEVTSEKLTFVEFFSPSCSHCKALAPIWKETYMTLHKELEEMNLQMLQVNCMESMDLCEREEVFSYPALRVYRPEIDARTGENVSGKSKFVDSFPRSLTRTPQNFNKFLRNTVAEFNSGLINLPSVSEQISLDDLLGYIAGKATEPIFIAFFPARDEDLKDTKTGTSKLGKRCSDCVEIKQTWDKVSNLVLSTVKTGHFSCHTNPTVCSELGLSDMANFDRRAKPKFIMFLPESTGVIRLDYNDEPTQQKLRQFATKASQNYVYQEMRIMDLKEEGVFTLDLPREPMDLYYPLENKIAIVLYYDKLTESPEDNNILPYMLEYVTESPFNINLYKASSEKVESNVNKQAVNIVDYINYDKNEPMIEYNHAMHLATILTSKPTILVFKQNTLYPSVYQNFAPEDMRDRMKIKRFIERNQFPLYQELSPELLPYYFNKNDKEKSDKIVVTFIESNDAREMNKIFYNISLAAHTYHYLKKEYYFNDLTSKREAKEQKVQKLKEGNANSLKIIKEMREAIPHFFDFNEVLFTFIDLSKSDSMAEVNGWKVDISKYKPGDSIIISKDNRYIWDKTTKGAKLRTDPTDLKKVLLSLLDSTLISNPYSKKRLLSSPYMDSLRFMDKVHDHGFFGYVVFFGGLYLLRIVFKRLYRKRKFHRSGPNTGLIGEPKND